MQEIEIKLLEINPESMRKKLNEIGAKFIGKQLLEAYLYDPQETNPNCKATHLRIRKSDDKATLTVKIKNPQTESSVKVSEEIELEIEDFSKMKLVLDNLGFKENQVTKKTRETYEFEDAEIVIDIYLDKFSYIPPLLEIECEDLDKIYSIVEKLGYKREDCCGLGFGGVVKYYNEKSKSKCIWNG